MSPSPHPLELLVIQPTPFCNLDCDYCYLPHRSDRRRISDAVLTRTFERVLESPLRGDAFTVIWHAGEPLVMPPSFYEMAIERLDAMSRGRARISHAFQTNATLVDERWCDLIRRHRIRVGVSVDGPEDVHDAHRKTRDGRGTHRSVVTGMRRLRDAGIDFHAIAVLTRESLDRADDIFEFFRAEGIRRVGFNVEEIEGDHRETTLDLPSAGAAGTAVAATVERRVEDFFHRIFALNHAAGDPLVIREHATLAGFILGGHPPIDRNQENEAFRILSVDCDGGVSTWSPEFLGTNAPRHGDFRLGNVMTHSLAEIAGSTATLAIRDEIERGVAACRAQCEYFPVCGGGSPANKYFELDALDGTETLHCRLSRQAVARAVLADLERAIGA